MATYAFLDENNIVTDVFVGVDENELIEGKSPEIWYGEFHNKKCLRTSYNTKNGIHASGKEPFRLNYAGVGMFYDESKDAFIFAKPSGCDSWVLDEIAGQWVSPVPRPSEIGRWVWNESTVNWIIDPSAPIEG